eukprot:TRINITY_DN9287_c0_g1_i1.p1 TRINITY_DN9287_c0_g1~~TRINITY_DN9287_c0_g1_i1.p1  ORF type:complete len:399 (-),score=68.87 TRINITY_DN9287_c0_g1_i1:264-1460(-)
MDPSGSEFDFKLTKLSKVCLVFLGLLVFGIICLNPFNIIVLPVILVIPTLLFYVIWNNLDRPSSFDQLVKLYTGTVVPGMVIVLIAEVMLSGIFAAIIYYDLVDDKDEMAKKTNGEDITQFRDVAFQFLRAFFMASMCEEALKYIMVNLNVGKCNKCALSPIKEARLYIVYYVTVCLAFAVTENFSYVFLSSLNIVQSFATAYIRNIFAAPLHVMCGLYQAFMLIRRDYYDGTKNILLIMSPAWFIHGLYDFILFVFSHSGSPLIIISFAMVPLCAFILWYLFPRHEVAHLVLGLPRTIPKPQVHSGPDPTFVAQLSTNGGVAIGSTGMTAAASRGTTTPPVNPSLLQWKSVHDNDEEELAIGLDKITEVSLNESSKQPLLSPESPSLVAEHAMTNKV